MLFLVLLSFLPLVVPKCTDDPEVGWSRCFREASSNMCRPYNPDYDLEYTREKKATVQEQCCRTCEIANELYDAPCGEDYAEDGWCDGAWKDITCSLGKKYNKLSYQDKLSRNACKKKCEVC